MIKKTGNELRILAESIVGQSITDESLPCEISNLSIYGGLAINASRMVEKSRELYLRGQITTNDLKTKLIAQNHVPPIKQDLSIYKKEKEIQMKTKMNEHIQKETNMESKRRIQENQMKWPNHWLIAAFTKAQGRYIPKQQFQDSIRLRLGLELKEMAPKCDCGNKNSVMRAKNCHRGGYNNLHYDSVRDYLQ